METSQRRMSSAEAFITKGLAVGVVIIAAIVLQWKVNALWSFAAMAATCALLLVGWIGAVHRASERQAKLQHEINNIKMAQSQHFHMTLDLLARLLCRTQPYWIKDDFLIIQIEEGAGIQITLSAALKMHCNNPDRGPMTVRSIYEGIEVFRWINTFAKTEHLLDVQWIQDLIDNGITHHSIEELLQIGQRHQYARRHKWTNINLYASL